jgi:DNA-directed RNA polymerase subunit RPC12/RpoP
MDDVNPDRHEGIVRTDMHCHHCDKNFIATLDYSIDGNHVVECPHCNHEHCRVIKNGMITGDRWDSKNINTVHENTSRVWKHSVLQIKTSSTANYIRDHFLRHRWLNREGV